MKLLALTLLLSVSANEAMAQASVNHAPQAATEAITGVSVTSALGSLLLVALREDMKYVQQDAHFFLAGDPMTDALEMQIKKARLEIPELEKLNDVEVVSFLLQLTEK